MSVLLFWPNVALNDDTTKRIQGDDAHFDDEIDPDAGEWQGQQSSPLHDAPPPDATPGGAVLSLDAAYVEDEVEDFTPEWLEPPPDQNDDYFRPQIVFADTVLDELVDDELIDNGFTAVPLDEGALADASIFAGPPAADDDGDADETPDGATAGPLDDASVVDATIFATQDAAESADDEIEADGFTAGPPAQDDEVARPPAPPAPDAFESDDDDGAADSLTAGPLDDAPVVDSSIFENPASADDDGDADEAPDGATSGPLDDAPVIDVSIFENLASADDDGDADETPDGATAGPLDNAPVVDASIFAAPDAVEIADEEIDGDGFTAGPPAQDDAAPIAVVAPVDQADDEDLDEAPGQTSGPLEIAFAVDQRITGTSNADHDDEAERWPDGFDEGFTAGPLHDFVVVVVVGGSDVAYETLRAWFETTWTATARRFENEALEPPAGLAPFVFFEVFGEFIAESEIGSGTPAANVWREEGEVVFHVMVATGSGTRVARGLAEDLARALKGLSLANGVRVGVLSLGGGEQLGGDGNYFDLPLVAQWARDSWTLGSD